MASWHRRARLGVAVFGLAVAGIVYAAMSERPVVEPRPPVVRVDEKAIAEIKGGTFERTIPLGVDRQVAIEADLHQFYPDGSQRWTGVKSIRVRRGEKEVVVSSREARAGPDGKELEITGDVKVQVSDGLEMATDSVTYDQDEGVTRAAGAMTFTKGRLSGSGVGFSYDEKTEVLTIAEQAHIVTKDDAGNTVTELTSSFATLDRMQDLLLLNDGAHVTRGSQVIEARDAVAQLSPNEDVVTFLELLGESRVTGAGSNIDAMSARDIELDYSDDGAVLERVIMRGGGAIAMTGQNGAGGRQILGNTLDLKLAPDGSLLRANGQGSVQLDLPAGGTTPARSIKSATLDAIGQEKRGLTAAILTGNVSFTEEATRGRTRRTARAQELQVSLANDAVTSATFTVRASFEEQALTAGAAHIDYQPEKGILALSGTAGDGGACVADSQVTVDARTILVTLEDHRFSATGDVKTQLRGQSAAKPGATCGGRPVTTAAPRAGDQAGSRLPGLLDPQASAVVTSDTLEYPGRGGRVLFIGATPPAAIIQGPTSIRAARIEIDQAKGDLIAAGSALSTIVLDGVDSTGIADEIRYTDARRLVTFTGTAAGRGALVARPAELRGASQGDLKAERIEVVLAKGESKVERMDATGDVTIVLETRKVTGARRLTYHAVEERYELEGTPLVLLERNGKECRESSGTTLTFSRTGTGVELDGQQQRRFQTGPAKACPATFR